MALTVFGAKEEIDYLICLRLQTLIKEDLLTTWESDSFSLLSLTAGIGTTTTGWFLTGLCFDGVFCGWS